MAADPPPSGAPPEEEEDDEEPPPYPGDDEGPPSYPTGPVIKCMKGHIMQKQSVDTLPPGCGQCGCSKCGAVGHPHQFVGCRVCDYDLCATCKANQLQSQRPAGGIGGWPGVKKPPLNAPPPPPAGVAGAWGGKSIQPAKATAGVQWASAKIQISESMLCKDHQNGRCERGERCKYTHQEQFDIHGPRDPELAQMIQTCMDHNPTYLEEYKKLCDRVWGAESSKYDPTQHPAAFLKNSLRHCCGGYYQGIVALPPRDSFKKGDWICPIEKGGCGSHNFAKRNTCMNCSRVRPLEDMLAGVIGGSTTGGGDSMKKGDWICDRGAGGCGALNFARRTECMTAGCTKKCPSSIPPPPGEQGPGICRLGKRCWRPDCNFDHPEGRDIDVLASHGPKMPTVLGPPLKRVAGPERPPEPASDAGSRAAKDKERDRDRDRDKKDKKDRDRDRDRDRRDKRSRERDRSADRRRRRDASEGSLRRRRKGSSGEQDRRRRRDKDSGSASAEKKKKKKKSGKDRD